MSRHTPGPWRVTKRDSAAETFTVGAVVRGKDGRLICQVGVNRAEVAEEANANARLIAQAPDLLYYADSAIGALKQIRDDNIDEDGWAFVDELIAEFAALQRKIEGGKEHK